MEQKAVEGVREEGKVEVNVKVESEVEKREAIKEENGERKEEVGEADVVDKKGDLINGEIVENEPNEGVKSFLCVQTVGSEKKGEEGKGEETTLGENEVKKEEKKAEEEEEDSSLSFELEGEAVSEGDEVGDEFECLIAPKKLPKKPWSWVKWLKQISMPSKSKKAVKEEEEGDAAPPRTKNELETLPLEQLVFPLPQNSQLIGTGTVKKIFGNQVTVESLPMSPVLDLSTPIFLEGHPESFGVVEDVFGPVSKPFYLVRISDQVDKSILSGCSVFCASQLSSFVVPEKIYTKGSDASGLWDEEPDEKDLEYSDDEEERVAKKKGKRGEKGEDENESESKEKKKRKRRKKREEIAATESAEGELMEKKPVRKENKQSNSGKVFHNKQKVFNQQRQSYSQQQFANNNQTYPQNFQNAYYNPQQNNPMAQNNATMYLQNPMALQNQIDFQSQFVHQPHSANLNQNYYNSVQGFFPSGFQNQISQNPNHLALHQPNFNQFQQPNVSLNYNPHQQNFQQQNFAPQQQQNYTNQQISSDLSQLLSILQQSSSQPFQPQNPN